MNTLRDSMRRRFLSYPVWLWLAWAVGVGLAFTPWAPLSVVAAALGFPVIWYIRLFREMRGFAAPFIYRLLLNAIVFLLYVGHDANRSGFLFVDLIGAFLTLGIAVVGLSIQRFVGYSWRELLMPHLLYTILVSPALPAIIVSAILRAMGYPF